MLFKRLKKRIEVCTSCLGQLTLLGEAMEGSTKNLIFVHYITRGAVVCQYLAGARRGQAFQWEWPHGQRVEKRRRVHHLQWVLGSTGLDGGAVSNEAECRSQIVKGPSQGFGVRAPFRTWGWRAQFCLPAPALGAVRRLREQSLTIVGKEMGGWRRVNLVCYLTICILWIWGN